MSGHLILLVVIILLLARRRRRRAMVDWPFNAPGREPQSCCAGC